MIKHSSLILAVLATGILQAQEPTASAWDVSDTGVSSKEVTITTSEGSWLSIDVSPDGNTLVFDLLGDLYTLPRAGGDATLISGGPAMDRQPSFSPDGEQLVFISDRSGADNIWISDRDGSNARMISMETINKVSNPAWAPDGEYIAAFRSMTHGPEKAGSRIVLWHIGGGNGRTLVDRPATMSNVNEPRFTPDGEQLIYTEKTGPGFLNFDANQPLFTIKELTLRTGESRAILSGFGSATTGQVSPDGRRIAFIRRVKDKTVLFVYDRNTGQQIPVYDDLPRDGHIGLGAYGYYPHFDWFPDSRSVAIWGRGDILEIDVDDASARVIPFEATATHTILDVTRFRHELVPESFNVQAITDVTTAPDGESIVFSALGRLWRKSASRWRTSTPDAGR